MPAQDIDFDYQLNHLSVIFDVGGYTGDFAEMIRTKYGCGIHIFEPVSEHFKRIVERFKHDPMYWPYDIALGSSDREGHIFLNTNSSSMFIGSGTTESVKVRDIAKFIGAFKFFHIDLLKLNCEGSEYEILDRIYDMKWIENVKQIVVQFHGIGKDIKQSDYEDRLSLTHECKYRDDHWQWWKVK